MAERTFADLQPGERILLGPGPSDVHPRVLRAMAQPLVGHLDPDFLSIMNEIRDLLQYVFETGNELTLAMSGTGSAGMETCLVNLLEPGDRIVIGVNGLFGQRMVDVARRCGADVVAVEAPWGRTLDPEAIGRALREGPPARAVAVVHAETSTGILQPLEEIGRLAHEHGALFVVDCVTSLGGAPVAIDRRGVDAAYSGTQKCLSCPPGLSPVTFGPAARARLAQRRQPVQSWYLDLTMIERYWADERFYHHTAPISMLYALREALRLVHEEGLEARFARHRRLGEALQRGLQALGLELFAEEGYRAPMLTTVRIPEGVDDLRVRRRLLGEFGIEIGGGLGPTKGRIWRIGLMGHSCHFRKLAFALGALASALSAEGFRCDADAAVAAARAVLGSEAA